MSAQSLTGTARALVAGGRGLLAYERRRPHVSAAQRALCHRARCNSAARRGEYGSAMEGA